MNPASPNPSLPAPPVQVQPQPLRGIFASLERLINTASFVSVDLTDTVFVSLHEQRDRENGFNR